MQKLNDTVFDALVVIPFHIDGGIIEVCKTGIADGKFHVLYLEWDITATIFWAVVIGGGFGTLFSYTADQSMTQRYLTTKDEKAAAKGLWLNVAMKIPTGLHFTSITNPILQALTWACRMMPSYNYSFRRKSPWVLRVLSSLLFFLQRCQPGQRNELNGHSFCY